MARLEDFKAPEGLYTFHSERPSRAPFSTTRACRLTYAELPPEVRAGARGGGGAYVIHNALEFLYISEYANPDREPVRSLHCGSAGGAPPSWPTCHAHAPTPEGVDLLIGLNTGDVLVTSLSGQVAAQRGDSRRAACLHFNIAGGADRDGGGGGGGSGSGGGSNHGSGGGGARAGDGSRVTGVAWLSPTQGTFAAAHARGTLYIYQKRSLGQDGQRVATQLRSVVSVPGPPPVATLHAGSLVAAIAAAPDGSSIAAACADGVLRIYDTATQRLTGGFKSYHGGLLCCAWSGDGRFIATGGEDDLVSVYSMADADVVAWGGGHASWVSSVTFDTWAHGRREADDVVRVLSAGHDGQLAAWDFNLSPEALTPVSPRMGPAAAGAPAPAAARRLFSRANDRQNGSGAGGGGFADGAIAPSPLHADMTLQTPEKIRRLHTEPVSGVLPTPGALFLASHSSVVRCWQRPPLPPRQPATTQDNVEPMEQEAEQPGERVDAAHISSDGPTA